MNMDLTTGIDRATTCCDADDLPSATDLAFDAVTILNELHLTYDRWSYIITGSVVFNGAGNDVDIVVGQTYGAQEVDARSLARGGAVDAALVNGGWHCTAVEGYPTDGFLTFRNGRFNLIVTTSPLQRWTMARNACAALSILNGGIDKAERVAVHMAIVDNADVPTNIGEDIANQVKHFRAIK